MLADIAVAFLELLYFLALVGLALFGVHSLVLMIMYWRQKNRPRPTLPPPPEDSWPVVTVQLPVYNERYTIGRLLKSVSQLDYPRDRLQVQVLDDSTDLTTEIIARLVREYRAQGLDIECRHRTNRQGYKAGALAEGLAVARGELVAIFDADFLPPPDWLRKVVPEFADPKLGCFQTRWGHANREFSALTRAQALGIDGHFVIEQTVRSANGLFLNFNGTAGIWRRSCIQDAGGWQSDTLTEDLDLSYRAQLCGWRIGYRPDVVVPAELPAQIEALLHQQFRWAKGSIQTVRKILPRLYRHDIPWRKRIFGTVHLLGYVVHPLMLAALLLSLPVGYFASGFFRVFPWTGLAIVGPPLLYAGSRTVQLPRVSDRLKVLPVLVLLGFGLSLSNTLAVIEGLVGDGGKFERTPKFDLGNGTGAWISGRYAPRHSAMVWGELALAAYAMVTVVVLWSSDTWTTVPWMMAYAAGYLFVAGLTLLQIWQQRLAGAEQKASAASDRLSVS